MSSYYIYRTMWSSSISFGGLRPYSRDPARGKVHYSLILLDAFFVLSAHRGRRRGYTQALRDDATLSRESLSVHPSRLMSLAAVM